MPPLPREPLTPEQLQAALAAALGGGETSGTKIPDWNSKGEYGLRDSKTGVWKRDDPQFDDYTKAAGYRAPPQASIRFETSATSVGGATPPPDAVDISGNGSVFEKKLPDSRRLVWTVTGIGKDGKPVYDVKTIAAEKPDAAKKVSPIVASLQQQDLLGSLLGKGNPGLTNGPAGSTAAPASAPAAAGPDEGAYGPDMGTYGPSRPLYGPVGFNGQDPQLTHLRLTGENSMLDLPIGSIPAGLAAMGQKASGNPEIGRASCRERVCQYV